VAIRRLELHRNWLSCRFLAERLRSALYLAPTGVDFRRTAGLEAVYVQRRAEDWLLRAFEEVWDARPRPATGEAASAGADELKRRLAEEWVGGQSRYHARAAARHARRASLLGTIVLLLFLCTLVFAVLHALEAAGEIAAFLSIVLPVAGASLGVVLTVSQHRALAERYGRMHADLALVRRALLDAADVQAVRNASAEAARVIASESGDWLGAMWFLDIEHPP
jgi:hypothetical protein